MDYDKTIEQLHKESYGSDIEDLLLDAVTSIKVLRGELAQMTACVYYKPGGLCRYGGDDPANVCVLGPCPYERSAEDVLADLARVTAERDAAVKQLHGSCPACAHYTPNHNEGPCAGCKHEYFQYQNIDAKDNWEWRGIKED